ncbi:MAG: hypothetical protein OEM97_07725 [Acidimicrobiia bacterium]|nr:hypothetical protein [Acidimicrobiia bacterium]
MRPGDTDERSVRRFDDATISDVSRDLRVRDEPAVDDLAKHHDNIVGPPDALGLHDGGADAVD